ncbi:MAG TPA: Plug domain-containing protein [Steroidobacteraceae bacterium]
MRSLVLGLALGATCAATAAETSSDTLTEVTVTASRLNLLGTAATASQGSVTEQELDLRPAYRVGQLLESVPGLVVTVHSGEGKANQYLARGFNLDHGTDIANFVDDMPVNRPTNTHGQGYSDLNFIVPELANGLDYTKGPYYASVGDFGSVAATHMKLVNDLPNQVSLAAGTLGVYTRNSKPRPARVPGVRWPAGQDAASAPSRRRGVELSGQYRPRPDRAEHRSGILPRALPRRSGRVCPAGAMDRQPEIAAEPLQSVQHACERVGVLLHLASAG